MVLFSKLLHLLSKREPEITSCWKKGNWQIPLIRNLSRHKSTYRKGLKDSQNLGPGWWVISLYETSQYINISFSKFSYSLQSVVFANWLELLHFWQTASKLMKTFHFVGFKNRLEELFPNVLSAQMWEFLICDTILFSAKRKHYK